jgi:hypothetical protein
MAARLAGCRWGAPDRSGLLGGNGMQGLLERMSVCFAAGVFGTLVSSLGLWLAGHYGWTAALGVRLAPSWDAAWIHPRLVWGGLWGLLFLPPILENSIVWRGLFLSLCPTLAQLIIFFPQAPEAGVWGAGLGTWTPLVVAAANALWGWGAAIWVLAGSGGGRTRYHRLR